MAADRFRACSVDCRGLCIFVWVLSDRYFLRRHWSIFIRNARVLRKRGQKTFSSRFKFRETVLTKRRSHDIVSGCVEPPPASSALPGECVTAQPCGSPRPVALRIRL
jgi:hypothetical protein